MVNRRQAIGMALVVVIPLSLFTPAAGCPPDDAAPPILRLEQCGAGEISIDTPLKKVIEALGAPDLVRGGWADGRWVHGELEVWLNEGLVTGFMVRLTQAEENGVIRTEPDIRFGATPRDVSEIIGRAPSGRLENSLVYPFAACCVLIELDDQEDMARGVVVVPPPDRWRRRNCEDEEECKVGRELEELCSAKQPE